jgi:soluble lytic murein transglycosylase-like protein
MSRLLRSTLLLLGLACALVPARAAEVEGGEEAPVIAGLLEAGLRAERLGAHHAAEMRFCAAARLGSSEGQYRLGRLYLTVPALAVAAPAAVGLLGLAAQTGHAPAQALLASRSEVPGEALPTCLQREVDVLALASEELPGRIDPRDLVTRLSPARQSVARLVEQLAPAFGVDPRLALAIARVESNFDPEAISPRNALGVMQLIPATAARFAVRDPLNAEQNVRGGLAYLRWLLATFDGDVLRVAAAYNAGEGAVQRHGGVPPYAETREYVRRVLALYGAERHDPPAARLVAIPTPVLRKS